MDIQLEKKKGLQKKHIPYVCLLYTSDAADD